MSRSLGRAHAAPLPALVSLGVAAEERDPNQILAVSKAASGTGPCKFAGCVRCQRVALKANH